MFVCMYVLYHSLRNNFKVILMLTTMTKCFYFYLNLKLRGQVFLLLSFFFDVLKLIIDYHRTEQHPKCLLKPLLTPIRIENLWKHEKSWPNVTQDSWEMLSTLHTMLNCHLTVKLPPAATKQPRPAGTRQHSAHAWCASRVQSRSLPSMSPCLHVSTSLSPWSHGQKLRPRALEKVVTRK